MATAQQQLYSPVPKIIDCKQGAIRAAHLNVDGTYCITCGADKSIKLWNPHRELLLKTYAGHGFEVLDARGSTGEVLIWDFQCRKPLLCDVNWKTWENYRG